MRICLGPYVPRPHGLSVVVSVDGVTGVKGLFWKRCKWSLVIASTNALRARVDTIHKHPSAAESRSSVWWRKTRVGAGVGDRRLKTEEELDSTNTT